MNKKQETITTPRPVPVFNDNDEVIFSTKKARAQTERKYRPPPPPHPARVRSTLCRSRVRSCLPEAGAVAVSFRDDSDSSVLINSVYNTAAHESYLEQCFEQRRLIGSGCFGEVFSARSRLDGKMYAIKKTRQCFRSDADRRRRLEEVRKHERLPRHRHCVAFHAAWEEHDHLYLQTELCQTSLAELAERDHCIPESTVWAYMVDLLLAIKHLHENQLIHLDIKPENIFVMREGYCKLGDFGLVMDVSNTSDLNDSDVTEGDPKYLAPELMRGHFSPAADVFSLGMTLLELACDLELPAGAAGWHRLRAGRLPAPLRERISDELRDVLESMLTPQPERRPTAAELLARPAVRSARWRRQIDIATRTMLVAAGGAVSRLCASLLSGLVFLLWLVYWPARLMGEACPAPPPPEPTPTSGFQQPGWQEPAFSDDDELDLSVDELHLSCPPPVRSSTPQPKRQDSLRRVLAFGTGEPELDEENEDEDEEEAVPAAASPSRLRLSAVRRQLSRSPGFAGLPTDGSPVTRRRHAARPRAAARFADVQQRLDFRSEFSDDD